MDKPLTPAELMRQLMDDFQDNGSRDAVGSLFQPETIQTPQRTRLMERGGIIDKALSKVSTGAEANVKMRDAEQQLYKDMLLTFKTWLQKTPNKEGAVSNKKEYKNDQTKTMIRFLRGLGFDERNVKEILGTSGVNDTPKKAATKWPPKAGTLYNSKKHEYKWSGNQWEKKTPKGKWQSGLSKDINKQITNFYKSSLKKESFEVFSDQLFLLENEMITELLGMGGLNPKKIIKIAAKYAVERDIAVGGRSPSDYMSSEITDKKEFGKNPKEQEENIAKVKSLNDYMNTKFSDEEKKILLKYQKSNVNQFIQNVDASISDKYVALLIPYLQSHRNDADTVKTSIMQILKYNGKWEKLIINTEAFPKIAWAINKVIGKV